MPRRRPEMGEQARPGSAGCNKATTTQRGVGARVLGGAHHARSHGRVSLAAAAGDHRHPALRHLDRDLDHPPMLVADQASRSRRSCRTAPARCCPRRSAIRRTRGMCLHRHGLPEKGHQCRYRPEKHELFAFTTSFAEVDNQPLFSADKDRGRMMSSMRRVAFLLPLLLVTPTAAFDADALRRADRPRPMRRRPPATASAMRSTTGGGCGRAAATASPTMPAS